MWTLTFALALAHDLSGPTVAIPPPPDLALTGVPIDLDGDGVPSIVQRGPTQGLQAWTVVDGQVQLRNLGGPTDNVNWDFAGAELDGDGVPDIVAGIDGTLSAYLSSSDHAVRVEIDGRAADVFRPADMDGDGDTDIVFSNPTGVYVALNLDGDGERWSIVDTGASAGYHVFDVADADRDGDVDICVTSPARFDHPIIYDNQGQGIRWVATPVAGLQSFGTGEFAFDLDADGDPDLVDDDFNVAFGLPGFAFDPPVAIPWSRDIPVPIPHTTQLLDQENRDAFRWDDATQSIEFVQRYEALWMAVEPFFGTVAGVGTDGSLRMWDPSTTPATPLFVAQARAPQNMISGDIDGDGSDDLVELADDGVHIWHNSGDGTSWRSTFVPAEDVEAVQFEDLDGDGRPELFLLGATGVHRLTEGVAGWRRVVLSTVPCSRLDIVDLDGDGMRDLVYARAYTEISWQRGQPQGFDPVAPLTTLPSFLRTWTDIDGDGDLDAIAGAALVVVNDGSSWLPPVVLAVPVNALYRWAGDVDDDGDVDLVFAGSASGSPGTPAPVIAFNTTGQGLLWDVVPTPSLGYGATPVDLDGNGRTSFLGVANGRLTLSSWTVQQGQPVFTSEDVGAGPWSIGVADIDGDGDMDVLASDSALTVYHNDHVPSCPDDDVDGVCNADDLCWGDDATGDGDGDGTCDELDLCGGDDATGDSDADGTCDDLDFCTGLDFSGDGDGDGICNDLDFTLAASAFQAGQPIHLAVWNAGSRSTVEIYATMSGAGDQPCVYGVCGDLERPVRIARGTSSVDGFAVLTLVAPSLPSSARISLQAVAIIGASVNTSQVVLRRVR